jgi:hypothetical protein
MNSLPSLSDLRHGLSHRLNGLRKSRLMADHLSVGLVVASLILNGLTLVILLVKLRPLDYQVPIHYSSLTGFDQLGNWYQPYVIAFFGLAVTIANTALAIRSFGRSRVASFYLLLGSVVVGVFCLIIANAFSSVS